MESLTFLVATVRDETRGEVGASSLANFMRLWARNFFGDLRRRDRVAVLGAMPGLGAVTGNELKLLFLQANHRLTMIKAAPPVLAPKGLTPSSIDEMMSLADQVLPCQAGRQSPALVLVV